MLKKCLVIGDLNIDLILFGLKYKQLLGGEVRSKGHYLDIGGSGGIFTSVLSQLGIVLALIRVLKLQISVAVKALSIQVA
jgi:hypothetical protein